MSAPDDGLTDVLFVIGSGTAPALRSRQFRLPIPVQERLVLLSVSFPVMAATSTPQGTVGLTVDEGPSLTAAPVTSIDLMARRRLKDDMPGIMLRATVRSTASAVLQYQAQRAGDNKQNAAAFGAVAALVTVGSMVKESADDRTWRTLPSEIAIARARLPAGAHNVTLHTPQGPRSARVQVSGRHAVVDFRLLPYQLFVQSPLQQEAHSRESPE